MHFKFNGFLVVLNVIIAELTLACHKGYGVGIDFPLSRQLDICRNCIIEVIFTFSFKPTFERVTDLFRIAYRSGCLAVIDYGLRLYRTSSVCIEGYSITICLPYCIQSYGCAVFRGQIYYRLSVFKFLRIGIIGCSPTEEGVARAAECIGCQLLRCAILERLIRHRARNIAAISVEDYSITICLPYRIKSYGCAVYRSQIIN